MVCNQLFLVYYNTNKTERTFLIMILIHPKAGLGNQMFIYAFGKALSLEYNEKLCLDLEWFTESKDRVYGLCNLNLPKETLFIEDHLIIKLSKRIILKLLRPLMKNTDSSLLKKLGIFNANGRIYEPVTQKPSVPFKIYYGPFQSAKYFEKYREIISNDLKVITPLSSHHAELILQMQQCQSVCLHIRRGDYLNSPAHNVCSIKYFSAAIQKMNTLIDHPVYFVFSDDIAWCKENLPTDNFIYCSEKNNQDYEELRLMYNCKHFIIPNSTFSWWAQYLGTYESKKVIAPDRWYNGEDSNLRDIYMPEWILIKAE